MLQEDVGPGEILFCKDRFAVAVMSHDHIVGCVP